MTKAIRVDAEAEEEIAHAIDRYEGEQEGLGAELWDELRSAMQTLGAPGPACGPVIGLPRELGVRRKLLVRFPYAIVFVEGDTFVRVISVMHGHRTGVLEPSLVRLPGGASGTGRSGRARATLDESCRSLTGPGRRRSPIGWPSPKALGSS